MGADIECEMNKFLKINKERKYDMIKKEKFTSEEENMKDGGVSDILCPDQACRHDLWISICMWIWL